MPVTRLAPSPTGALHMGNARTFLLTYLLAKQGHWTTLCRMEDIDGPRIKPHADQQALSDLSWLGINWDGAVFYQSSQLQKYVNCAHELLRMGFAYPCTCSRSEVDSAASAPHPNEPNSLTSPITSGASVYPGTCRGRYPTLEAARAATGREPCLRFQMPDHDFTFHDGFKGPITIPGHLLGDFPILKADQTPAYQLACILDDTASGITHVIRGDDLLDSTPRQIALAQALGLTARLPTYTHLPLVIGPDGRRLAKRHGDTRISAYRDEGHTPAHVLAILAKWSNIPTPKTLQSAQDLVGHFSLQNLPPTPATLTESQKP